MFTGNNKVWREIPSSSLEYIFQHTSQSCLHQECEIGKTDQMSPVIIV